MDARSKTGDFSQITTTIVSNDREENSQFSKDIWEHIQQIIPLRSKEVNFFKDILLTKGYKQEFGTY